MIDEESPQNGLILYEKKKDRLWIDCYRSVIDAHDNISYLLFSEYDERERYLTVSSLNLLDEFCVVGIL